MMRHRSRTTSRKWSEAPVENTLNTLLNAGGTKVSPSTISALNKKGYKYTDAWRNRAIEGDFPHVVLDGLVLKRSWSGAICNVSVMAAIAMVEDATARCWTAPKAIRKTRLLWITILQINSTIKDWCRSTFKPSSAPKI